jgi:hypothetical protein
MDHSSLADFACRPRHEPALVDPDENRVTNLQAARRELGLPSDRAHIEHLLADRSLEHVEGYGPATPEEARYLSLREDDEGSLDHALEYLESKEPAYTWAAIRDDWPRDPCLEIFVTADVERIRGEVERRRTGPARFEVVLVPELREPAPHVPIPRRRPDRVDLSAGAFAYTAHDGVCRLAVHYISNRAYRFLHTVAEEDADQVTVGIVECSPAGPISRAGQRRAAHVQLSAPLAGRRVLDARSGRELAAM